MAHDSTSTTNPPGEPAFLAVVQFVALITLLPAITSFGLFGVQPALFDPYYLALSYDERTVQVTSLPIVYARSFADQQSWPNITLVLVALGLWLYAAINRERRQYCGRLAFALCVPTGLMVYALVLFCGYVFGGARGSGSSGPAQAVSSAYPVLMVWLPKIAFLWFAIRGRILSRATALFIAFTAIWPIVTEPFAQLSLFSQVLAPLMAFFAAALLVRLIYLAIVSDSYVLRHLGWKAGLRDALRATAFWIPLVFLAVPYFAFEHGLEVSLNATLQGAPYPFDPNAKIPAAVLASARLMDGTANPTLPGDLVTDSRPIALMFVAMAQLKAYQAVISEVAAAQGLVNQAANLNLSNLADRALTDALQPTLTLPPYQANTGGNDPVSLNNLGRKMAAPVVDSAVDTSVGVSETLMEQSYSKVWNQLDQDLRSVAVPLQAQIDQGAAKATLALDSLPNKAFQIFAAASKAQQLSIWYAFAFGQAFEMLTRILFAFLCVKSFLYIFARVTFSQDSGTYLTLGETEGTPVLPDPKITQFPSRFVLHPPGPAVYYVARKFQGRGKPPRLAVPQPLHAPIARLIHGETTMNRVEFKTGDGPVSYTAQSNAEFVVWDLEPGEVVVFSFANFFAMSENVQINTLISVRLSTLLLDEIIFSTATGPGQLIFRTDGRAEVTGREEAGESFPPDRLVAMHMDARLYVESELRPVDVYFSDAYVRPQGTGRVIVDVDKRQGSMSGLARFFSHFIWPG